MCIQTIVHGSLKSCVIRFAIGSLCLRLAIEKATETLGHMSTRWLYVDCKERYKTRVEQHVRNCDTKSGWAGLQFISGYKKKQV